ncbi:MAG: hypothetical protein D4R79_12450 [Comamonadaceae bacterium]|nr:MAG: hypothetical protein D4R79_12450 [Comamonadaceae bacterium]
MLLVYGLLSLHATFYVASESDNADSLNTHIHQMIDRRKFLQVCSSAVSVVSLRAPSRSLSLPRPLLFSPDGSTDALPTAIEEVFPAERQIKVIGVGGYGSNAVHHMITSGVTGVA